MKDAESIEEAQGEGHNPGNAGREKDVWKGSWVDVEWGSGPGERRIIQDPAFAMGWGKDVLGHRGWAEGHMTPHGSGERGEDESKEEDRGLIRKMYALLRKLNFYLSDVYKRNPYSYNLTLQSYFEIKRHKYLLQVLFALNIGH